MPTVGRLVLCTVALSAAPAMGFAQSSAPVDDATLVRRIDAYVGPLGAHELSGTLLVARGGRVLVERSFGFASHELRVPFAPTTPTNVASITKPLTIIIASRLVEEKRIALGDTVARWLPEYVHGKRMTVNQLMNHTAGVPHRLLSDDAQEEPKTATEMVLAANALPLLFEPELGPRTARVDIRSSPPCSSGRVGSRTTRYSRSTSSARCTRERSATSTIVSFYPVARRAWCPWASR